jgi:hypothetical protein
MSEKAKAKLNKKPFNPDTKVTISVNDFQYLKNVELIKNSVNYYIQQIQGEYLKLLSLNLGYKPEQDLTFNIDLQSTTRELVIHELTELEKEKIASKN